MSEEIYNPPESVSANAFIQNMEQYREMYDRSINDFAETDSGGL